MHTLGQNIPILSFFGSTERKDVVKQLGEQGLVSVSDDMNMENYQKWRILFCLYFRHGRNGYCV